MGIMQKQFADLITFTRASAGGYRNWQGVYTMAAANERRIDHDPASVSLSTATVTLGAGQHTFTTTHAYQIGEWLRASADANNWMVGRVVVAGEGSVTIEVAAARVRGSGTYSSWTLIVCLGLLIEEQRTNLIRQSEDLSRSPWGGAWVDVQPGAEVGRNGASLSRLTETVSETAAYHDRSQVVTLNGGDVLSITFLIKFSHERNREVQVYLPGIGGLSNGIRFRTDGVVGGGGITQVSQATLENLRDDLYLATIVTKPATASGNTSLFIRVGLNTGVSFYVGDGTSHVFVGEVQVEKGFFPTSYIPATDAQVTRAADIASINTLEPWYRADEGTLIVEYISGPTAGSRTPLVVGKGSPIVAKILMQFTVSGSARNRAIITSATGMESVFPIREAIANTLYKQGVTWDGTSAANALNGASPSVLAGKIIPDMPDRIAIGSQGNGVNALNGHIRVLRFYPKALHDQLQEMAA